MSILLHKNESESNKQYKIWEGIKVEERDFFSKSIEESKTVMSKKEKDSVKVRIKSDYLEKIDEKFRDNYSIIDRKEEWIKLELKADYNSELVPFILSLSDSVEVTEPEILRKEIVTFIDSMKYIYEENEKF